MVITVMISTVSQSISIRFKNGVKATVSPIFEEKKYWNWFTDNLNYVSVTFKVSTNEIKENVCLNVEMKSL